MTRHEHNTPATLAIFTLAAIKAAIDGFENGDTNALGTLDAVVEAIDDFRAAATDRSRREAA